MQARILPSVPVVEEKKRHWPAISVIMPFEPVIEAKDEIMQRFQKALNKVEWEVSSGYDEDLSDLVLLKLKSIFKNLNFSTFKKSIAIYVSPVFEKILYLNIPVVETITVNDFFFIRDIIHSKRDIPAFFVLVLNEKWSSLYEGDKDKLIKIKSNGAGNIQDIKHTSIGENENDDNTFFVKQFLRHTDEGLTIMLSAVPLPVLVVGNKNVLECFKSLTANGKSIVEYIERNHGKAAEESLLNIIEPYIADWKKIKIKHLYHQLEKASKDGQLIIGLTAVQQSIAQLRGRLLVVGKRLIYQDEISEIPDVVPGKRFNRFSCVRHVIDEIIEKVLENGGDIEMVDDEVLGGQHIVLVKENHSYI